MSLHHKRATTLSVRYGILVYLGVKQTLNVEILDLLINKLGYLDIRIVPFMTTKLISAKKSSVKTLFITFKNVMLPYVDQLLTDYPEAYESLYSLDTDKVLNKIIKHCDNIEKLDSISNIMFEYLLKNKTLNNDQYSKLTTLFINHINDVEIGCMLILVGKYKDAHVMDLVDLVFSQRHEDFEKIALLGIKNMPLEYKKYIEDSSFGPKLHRLTASYLKYILKDTNVQPIINRSESYLAEYLEDPNEDLARVIALLLNFVKDKSHHIRKVLKTLQEPNTINVLKLLQVVFKMASDLKKQISLLVPHISLTIDSTKAELTRETQNLLDVIEKKYKINPLID